MKALDYLEQSFLDLMEEKVRLPVQAMRRAGLNTECSCHHEGYITIQCLDPSVERDRIFNVMYELGIEEWTATLNVVHHAKSYISIWEVRSEAFKAGAKEG